MVENSFGDFVTLVGIVKNLPEGACCLLLNCLMVPYKLKTKMILNFIIMRGQYWV
jgi:hypothetical protein